MSLKNDGNNSLCKKVSCYRCGVVGSFDSASEVLDAGWDCPFQIILCPKCSSHVRTFKFNHDTFKIPIKIETSDSN